MNKQDNINPELRYAMEHSRDQDSYPLVFDDNAGLTLEAGECLIPEHPDWRPARAGEYLGKDENGMPMFKRQAKLEITSYRGISFNAVHYYGEIWADGIFFIDVQGHCHFGYISDCIRTWPEDKQALYSKIYRIEILRNVTQEEIDKEPSRWSGYKAGDRTNAFESVEEIKETAQKIFEARFPSGWEGLIIKTL